MPTDSAYDQLLDKAKSHNKAVAEYNQNKKSRKDSMAFPTNTSAFSDDVCSSDSQQMLPF